MNIYVGNLSRSVSEESLKELFEQHGEVSSAKVIKDKFTGESRGFGFVEMPSEDEGNSAIEALDGTEVEGRTLRVSKSHDKPAGPRRFNRDRQGGGFGNRSGGNGGGGFRRGGNGW